MLHAVTTILVVCAPLFVLLAFGAILRQRSLMGEQAQKFITWLVYWFSLPILVFLGVARQDFRSLLDPVTVTSTIGVSVVVAVGVGFAALLLPQSLRGPTIAASYLSNLAYIGFPLARNAFGDAGLTYAGIINAFTMPLYTVTGVVLLGFGRSGKGSVWRQAWRSLGNPVVIAAFAGLLVSLVSHETPLGAVVKDNALASSLLAIVVATLDPLASVGLPLSLIAVGASVRFSAIRSHRMLLIVNGVLKLVVMPLATLLVCHWLFPHAPRAAVGTAVLLMGCPVAVALYVFSKQLDAESEFVAGALAITTAASCITIPIWVAIVL